MFSLAGSGLEVVFRSFANRRCRARWVNLVHIHQAMQHISYILIPVLKRAAEPELEPDVQVATPAASQPSEVTSPDSLLPDEPDYDWDAEFAALQEENLGRYGY